MYTDEQKMLIALQSDLVGEPLLPKEAGQFREALSSSGGDTQAALKILSPDVSEKAGKLLGQGIRLSLELEKLGQRGVSVVFSEEARAKRVQELFGKAPELLFVAGELSILDDEGSPVSSSLDSFKDDGCHGVLVADRPFGDLLRDARVSDGLRHSTAVIVSDRYRSRATTFREGGERSARGRTAASRRRSSKSVFISGSRSQREIPSNVQKSLDAIIQNGFEILIGDSEKGVDNEIVDFLRATLYRHVTIYTVSERPRIAPEFEWEVRTVRAEPDLKGQARQMAKDRAMADAADWGLAVFRPIQKNRYGSLQVSAGTLRNTIQMLLEGKMVKFFYVYEGEMPSRNLKTLSDLEDVLEAYRSESLGAEEREAILSAKGVSPDEDPAFAKYSRILKKYRSLLKSESGILGVPSLMSRPQETLPLFG